MKGENPITTFEEAFALVSDLSIDFETDYSAIMASASETDVRNDYLNRFFTALGWDVGHLIQKNPYQQEVKLELSVDMGDEGRRKKADYSFSLAPNFRDPVFLVEAKKPTLTLATKDNYYQANRYGSYKGNPLVILTDFRELHIIDSRYWADINLSINRLVEKFTYIDFRNEEKFRRIFHLFSREAVLNGSIEKFVDEHLKKPKTRSRQGNLFPIEKVKSLDELFLADIEVFREILAKSFKRSDETLNGLILTEATQKTIDRLVFIRFLEDKLIEQEEYIDKFLDKPDAWVNFISLCRRLDAKYNGIVFKRTFIDNADFLPPDDGEFKLICEKLLDYLFNEIPIHILGSIYEQFLGKVVRATEKRVKVEEKPEVRKAGGVYYTPKYIVDNIISNTIGVLIEGKTPTEISKFRFADIACGSGSFLIGVYDYLLAYHNLYYYNNPEIAKKAGCHFKDGYYVLSIRQKQKILQNNIFGVDIDPQAVEVTQLSLALKMMEDETTATANEMQILFHEKILPDMSKNIICGNSLVSPDISDERILLDEEEEKINPLNFYSSFPEIIPPGFDIIIGNPPYVALHAMELTQEYFSSHYIVAKGQYNLFSLFVERSYTYLKSGGLFGYIIPSLFIKGVQHAPLRNFFNDNSSSVIISEHGDKVFRKVQMPTCTVISKKGKNKNQDFFINENAHLFKKVKTQPLSAISVKGIRRGLEIGKDKLTIDGNVEVVTGSDISQYSINKKSLISNATYKLFAKNDSVFKSPKILIRETGDRFISTVDYENVVTNRSIYNVKLSDSNYTTEFILGILCSAFFDNYFKQFISPNTVIFPKIRIAQLQEIPIPVIDVKNKNLMDCVNRITNLTSKALALRKKLNNIRTEAEGNQLTRTFNDLRFQIDELVVKLYSGELGN